MRPECMTDAELERWHEADSIYRRRAGTSVTPCFDCTAAFSDEMRSAGRCNGTPGLMKRIAVHPRAYRTEPYPTAEERIAARRATWRDSKRRRVEAMNS